MAAPATDRVRPAGARARAAAAAVAGGEAAPEVSYEQLVIDGDKALENGASGRALRLFERALKLQPDGAEALAGLGYVNLDRQRAEAAVSYFRRSLAVSPYAPAIFGMGEAYRALGDRTRALEAYQRYLARFAQRRRCAGGPPADEDAGRGRGTRRPRPRPSCKKARRSRRRAEP